MRSRILPFHYFGFPFMGDYKFSGMVLVLANRVVVF